MKQLGGLGAMGQQDHKLPTAEEFLETKTLSPSKDIYKGYNIPYSYLQSLLIEFAKIQVEAAAKNCLEKYHHASKEGYEFGSSEIMNSYNLNNIK